MSTERLLTFSVGTEEFAIPLLEVREVIAPPEVTPIPQAPSYFLGLMNLRGQVLSVLDLRTKLGVKPSGASETAVIICDLHPYVLGVMVDSVNSVLLPEPTDLAEKPEFTEGKASEFIQTIYRKGDRMVLVMDMGKTLNVSDRSVVERAKGKAA